MFRWFTHQHSQSPPMVNTLLAVVSPSMKSFILGALSSSPIASVRARGGWACTGLLTFKADGMRAGGQRRQAWMQHKWERRGGLAADPYLQNFKRFSNAQNLKFVKMAIPASKIHEKLYADRGDKGGKLSF
jgi:hypothetical protein